MSKCISMQMSQELSQKSEKGPLYRTEEGKSQPLAQQSKSRIGHLWHFETLGHFENVPYMTLPPPLLYMRMYLQLL